MSMEWDQNEEEKSKQKDSGRKTVKLHIEGHA